MNKIIRIVAEFEGKEIILAEYRGSLEGLTKIRVEEVPIISESTETHGGPTQ